MGLKFHLIAMTLVAVISDAMLMPFFPRYFAERFGIHDPSHVGLYIAAICLTATLALPVWTRVVRGRGTLQLLCWTQAGAGLLSIAAGLCDSLVAFWLLSLCMIAFKASYLLIYPYLMQGEPASSHAHTIGVLSIVVHFGGIAGALSGGSALQFLPVQQAYLLMALGDFIQMGMCMHVLRRGLARAETWPAMTNDARPRSQQLGIHALGVLMLLFYFSEYHITPFFVAFWQATSGWQADTLAAAVYAIPAGMALLALVWNRRRGSGGLASAVHVCLPMGMAGIALQATGDPVWILVGRGLFGWSLFQMTVRLDARLFELSTPDLYARDYSRINFYQNVGVLMSSSAAGLLVERQGLYAPFWVAIGGYLLCWLLYPLLSGSAAPATQGAGHARA